MDARSVARPLWKPSGIWRLARLARSSFAEEWQGRRSDAATTDLVPAEVSYTESASQTEFVTRVLAELEEEWQTFDRADPLKELTGKARKRQPKKNHAAEELGG